MAVYSTGGDEDALAVTYAAADDAGWSRSQARRDIPNLRPLHRVPEQTNAVETLKRKQAVRPVEPAQAPAPRGDMS